MATQTPAPPVGLTPVSSPAHSTPAVDLSVRKDNEKKIIAVGILLFVCVCLYPLYTAISPWVGIGIFFSVLVIIQLVMMLRRQVPFQQIMLFNFFLQLFAASLPLYYYPPLWIYDIGQLRYPVYLDYAVPACIAVYCGVALATAGIRTRTYQPATLMLNIPNWAFLGRLMCGTGLVFFVASMGVKHTSSISFVLVLFAALRWVGVFTLILMNEKRWWLYAGPVLLLEILFAVHESLFHDLFLWSVSLFLVLSFRYQWRFKAILGLACAALFLVFFQALKQPFREKTLTDTSVAGRLDILESLMSHQASDVNSVLTPVVMSSVLVRFNEGWIIDRVMRHVPELQPFAGGSTILTGLDAAFMPRFLEPNKPQAGGRVLFEQYTGMRLGANTSMAISVAGEMYANFGVSGGVIAMFLYGLTIGGLYRWLANKAYYNPVWWSWGPFVGLWAMKAEEDLMNIETWVVKGLAIMAFITFTSNRFILTRQQSISRPRTATAPGPKSADTIQEEG